MRLDTTIVDGVDLELAPVNYTEEPIKSTAIGKGHQGQVHFRWARPGHYLRLVLEYQGLSLEEARRILNVLGPTKPYDRELSFEKNAETVFYAPGRTRISLSMRRKSINATVETVCERSERTYLGDLNPDQTIEVL